MRTDDVPVTSQRDPKPLTLTFSMRAVWNERDGCWNISWRDNYRGGRHGARKNVRRGYQFVKGLKSVEKALSDTVDLALTFGFDYPKR